MARPDVHGDQRAARLHVAPRALPPDKLPRLHRPLQRAAKPPHPPPPHTAHELNQGAPAAPGPRPDRTRAQPARPPRLQYAAHLNMYLWALSPYPATTAGGKSVPGE